MTKPARKSLKDTLRANAQAMNYYAAMSGKPPVPVPDGSVKRGPNKPRTDGRKSESEVQREIIDYLLDNHHVAMVERHNSGAMQTDEHYVRFNIVMIPARLRPIGNLQRVRKPDLDVLLIDGKRFIIEVKREGWHLTNDQREREQENYLAHCRRFGCIAIFATSVREVRTAMIVHGYV